MAKKNYSFDSKCWYLAKHFVAAAYKLDEQPMTEWDMPDAWRGAIQQQRLGFDRGETDF